MQETAASNSHPNYPNQTNTKKNRHKHIHCQPHQDFNPLFCQPITIYPK